MGIDLINIIKKNKNLLKHLSIWLLPVIGYLLFSFYYMTPQVKNISDTLYGFGDSTAGAVWRYEAYPDSPFWGYEKQTNYPFGENISSPVHFSGSLQYIPYWLMSKVVGPIAAYNLYNIIGLVFSALMMFGFVFELTRRRSVAFFAGYAVAFTPYFQMKIGGHPTYAYQGLIIALVWLFFRLLKNRSLSGAILLSLALVSVAYLDVYLLLLASVAFAGLLVTWCLVNWLDPIKKKSVVFSKQRKKVLLSIFLAILLVIPGAILYRANSSRISAELSSARGNVLAEARLCSNYPEEYLAPFVLHPLFRKVFGREHYEKAINGLKANFSCGLGEDTVGVSITLLLLCALITVIVAWEKINKRKIGFSKIFKFEPKVLALSILVILLLAIALGLPPVKVLGIVPTPSYVLLKLTTTWRTLTRVYVLVNICVVIISAISLTWFYERFKKLGYTRFAKLLLIAVGCFVFIEYQSFRPFSGNALSNFSYKKDAPSAYYWLRGRNETKVIAEYPIEREGGESDAGSYYLTMQSIHKKLLFNSALSNSPQDVYRSGLRDLSDPQTIPALRAFGVDTVVVHGVGRANIQNIPNVNILYEAPQSAFNLTSHTPTVKNDNIIVIDISGASKADTLITLGKNFARNLNIIVSSADWGYEAVRGAEITAYDLSKGAEKVSEKNNTRLCFSANTSVLTDSTELVVESKDYSLNLGGITGVRQRYSINLPSSRASLIPLNGHNIRIYDLGCSANE